MRFVKMHGLGNDFILLGDPGAGDPAALAVRLCDRRFGVGADGLILALPSESADFRMRIFNPDGSEPEMCGNGIRCAAKFFIERVMREKPAGPNVELKVETLAGLRIVDAALDSAGQVALVTVDMGAPALEPADIPVDLPDGPILDRPIEVDGRTLKICCVSMGNPHCVVFIDEHPGTIDLPAIGPKLENHKIFPKRANVEFVRAANGAEADFRVWERGAGETLACGTGACAAAVAGCLTGRLGGDVTVHLPGGDLKIRWAGEGSVFMTGPATEVFEGEIGVPQDSER